MQTGGYRSILPVLICLNIYSSRHLAQVIRMTASLINIYVLQLRVEKLYQQSQTCYLYLLPVVYIQLTQKKSFIYSLTIRTGELKKNQRPAVKLLLL